MPAPSGQFISVEGTRFAMAGFIGMLFDSPVSSVHLFSNVTFGQEPPFSAIVPVVLDNVSIGTATTVPEPATSLLLLCSVALLHARCFTASRQARWHQPRR